MRRRSKGKIAVVASLALALSACATPPADPAGRAAFEQANDPLEPTNRVIFEGNMVLDRFLWEPIAMGYRAVVPEVGRTTLRNFLGWLREPTVLANNLLQLDMVAAGKTSARMLVNGFTGPFGLRDNATELGYPKQVGDFGQTLYRWGLGSGPYLMIPVLGPSNLRDGFGSGVDAYLDPLRYVAAVQKHGSVTAFGRFGMEGIDERERALDGFDELKKSSVDLYSQIRSVVQQRRAAQLKQPLPGMAGGQGAEDLYADPEAPAGAAGLPGGAPAGAQAAPPGSSAELVAQLQRIRKDRRLGD